MSRQIEDVFGDREPRFSTGTVADLVGCSVRTVRHYCNLGIVTPFRSASGRSKFSRLEVIDILRQYEKNVGIGT